MPVKKIALAVLLATVVILYFIGGGDKYLSISLYQDLYIRSPLGTSAIFFLIFYVGTTCSLPITGAMDVISGIDFGHLTGYLISIFAST